MHKFVLKADAKDFLQIRFFYNLFLRISVQIQLKTILSVSRTLITNVLAGASFSNKVK